MFSKSANLYVETAVQAEYEAAIEQHGATFESDREALDVLTEEVKETLQEAGKMYLAMQKKTIDLEALAEATSNAIKEAAQVLAVIRKYRTTKDPDYAKKISMDDVEYYR